MFGMDLEHETRKMRQMVMSNGIGHNKLSHVLQARNIGLVAGPIGYQC